MRGRMKSVWLPEVPPVMETHLGGSVDADEGEGIKGGTRGHVDCGSPASLQHARQYYLGHGGYWGHVNVALHILHRHFSKRYGFRQPDTHIVHWGERRVCLLVSPPSYEHRRNTTWIWLVTNIVVTQMHTNIDEQKEKKSWSDWSSKFLINLTTRIDSWLRSLQQPYTAYITIIHQCQGTIVLCSEW